MCVRVFVLVCAKKGGEPPMMSFLNAFQLSPVTSSNLGAEMWLGVWGPQNPPEDLSNTLNMGL